jgi:hypothetical protein
MEGEIRSSGSNQIHQAIFISIRIVGGNETPRAGGREMSDPGCSIPDKTKENSFRIQYPETSIQDQSESSEMTQGNGF